eukprot:UN2611
MTTLRNMTTLGTKKCAEGLSRETARAGWRVFKSSTLSPMNLYPESHKYRSEGLLHKHRLALLNLKLSSLHLALHIHAELYLHLGRLLFALRGGTAELPVNTLLSLLAVCSHSLRCLFA